jgi:hypothetical protein
VRVDATRNQQLLQPQVFRVTVMIIMAMNMTCSDSSSAASRMFKETPVPCISQPRYTNWKAVRSRGIPRKCYGLVVAVIRITSATLNYSFSHDSHKNTAFHTINNSMKQSYILRSCYLLSLSNIPILLNPGFRYYIYRSARFIKKKLLISLATIRSACHQNLTYL